MYIVIVKGEYLQNREGGLTQSREEAEQFYSKEVAEFYVEKLSIKGKVIKA